MTISVQAGLIIGAVLLVLAFLSSVLDLWGERTRRQAQRERWQLQRSGAAVKEEGPNGTE